MSSACSVIINGHTVSAKLGETLVDAALGGWMIIPHDCRSGQCETCRVTVLAGKVDANGTAVGRTVLACQATVSGERSDRVRRHSGAGKMWRTYFRDQPTDTRCRRGRHRLAIGVRISPGTICSRKICRLSCTRIQPELPAQWRIKPR